MLKKTFRFPHVQWRPQNIKDVKRLACEKSGYFTWKAWRGEVVSWQSSPRKGKKGRLKEIHLHPGFKVIQPSHPRSTWKIWSEDCRYSFLQKGVQREDSDWRESLTFKQALYPYRVGEDMHNPSKMHMNFPSSNSSRLNRSQWINYEYCMYCFAGDQIGFTVEKNNKNKSAILEYCIFRLSLKNLSKTFSTANSGRTMVLNPVL